MSWTKRREWAQSLLILVLGVFVVRSAIKPAAQPPATEVAIGGMGWVDDVEIRQPVAATMPAFSETAAFRAVQGEEPTHVYLWDAYRRLYGTNPPERDQGSVGSCVSFGTAHAIEMTLANQVLLGFAGEFRDVAQEVIYGGGRVEVGGGRIRGDGCVGAWAAKFVKQWGIVPRGVTGRYDLSRYDVDRCRAWGRTGVPDDLEPEAKKHPVGDAAQVTTWTEAKKALANGYGIAICSSQGFTTRRDPNGVCQPRGTWNHCMSLDGYHVDSDAREYGHITNSWGDNTHTGPVGWGNPNKAGFWADSRTIERMLRQDDSWAFSGVTGFPARKIDWDVQAPIPQRKERLFALEPKVLAW
jgi:hypothetical protein